MARINSLLSSSGFALGLAAVVSAQARGQSCDGDALALETRATLLLPATFGIQGVTAGPAGTLALWSSEGEVLLMDRARVITPHQLPDSIRPAGMVLTGEGLRLLDAVSGVEFRLAVGDTLVPANRLTLGPGEVLDQALWHDNGWILALRDLPARRFVLRRWNPAGATLLFRTEPADGIGAIPRFYLTDTGRGVILTRRTTPFDLIRVDPVDGTVHRLPAPLQGRADLIPADSLVHWRALAAVPLDCALLVTLSDLTADRRLLVRYGKGDQVARVTPLDAPLGLVAALPGETALLAARRAGELELVWYDWHWIREPSPSAP
jgi:hypothetical protein